MVYPVKFSFLGLLLIFDYDRIGLNLIQVSSMVDPHDSHLMTTKRNGDDHTVKTLINLLLLVVQGKIVLERKLDIRM